MIEKLFLSLMEVTISTSLIIIPLLLISPIIKKKYTSKWQYILWLIICFRLIIPINIKLPETTFKIPVPITMETFDYTSNEISNTNPNEENTVVSHDSPESSETLSESTTLPPISNTVNKNTNKPVSTLNITPLKMVSIIWLIVSFLYLIYQFLGYFSLKKNLLRWSRPASDETTLTLFKRTCTKLNITRPIKIMTCKKILSPMALGLFHPIILLPDNKIPQDELSIILKHELIHIKRHDISYKLLLTIANSLHWFNPTVYFMVKEAHKDLEFYCDEMVVKNMDINYKTRYSEAILAVMHSKTNCTSILSTNFNGGVKTMKKRFRNIFDNRKKKLGILSLAFTLAVVLCGSSLVACQSSQKSSPEEETATSFLKGYYEVDNILLLKELQDLFMEQMATGIVHEGDGGSLVTMSDEGLKIYSAAALKNVKEYITDSFGETLVSKTAIERTLQSAYAYNYTLKVSDIELTLAKDKTTDKLSYDYTLNAKLTYQQDGTSETQVLTGQISLEKVDNKWLVSHFGERALLNPNKKYYNPEPIGIPETPKDTSTTDSPGIFSDPVTLCEAYIQAMIDSDFTFIADHTVNSLNNTTIEEGQKTWDTIKIDSGLVINGHQRASSKHPDLLKGCYEISINVSEPGNSDFIKGENTRWLYLSYTEKGGWVVENFVSTGTPDELWWDIVNGG